jgi:hypothetical protein
MSVCPSVRPKGRENSVNTQHIDRFKKSEGTTVGLVPEDKKGTDNLNFIIYISRFAETQRVHRKVVSGMEWLANKHGDYPRCGAHQVPLILVSTEDKTKISHPHFCNSENRNCLKNKVIKLSSPMSLEKTA